MRFPRAGQDIAKGLLSFRQQAFVYSVVLERERFADYGAVLPPPAPVVVADGKLVG